jgi:hypothetical protein
MCVFSVSALYVVPSTLDSLAVVDILAFFLSSHMDLLLLPPLWKAYSFFTVAASKPKCED